MLRGITVTTKALSIYLPISAVKDNETCASANFTLPEFASGVNHIISIPLKIIILWRMSEYINLGISISKNSQ
ncbi:hypothetical protein CDL62_17735 [Alkalitalea saponilacus]|uniref:Uncharacterized protein n=1 Tax=Alkalitalea saponilacus TaxID=889453 RepID=A0A1T5H779_9BACT|nr:hypothetical protein CDL62_17735 [Alkalitalea saponilacus]SKC16528.1 hypothetical protein SAMN03080601_02112 [Alkalitalea saponilacus]